MPPAPETGPQPQPDPTAPPSPSPTPQSDDWIYREASSIPRPKDVALRRTVDWVTGLSFSRTKPSPPYLKYSMQKLVAAGYIVRPDGGQPITDVHTGLPPDPAHYNHDSKVVQIAGRKFGTNHVSIYLPDMTQWDAWYNTEQQMIGQQNYVPSSETTRLFNLREINP